MFDLQASQYQNYQTCIQKLARLLNHEDLKLLNEQLIASIDIDAFLEKSRATESGMSGTATLEWTDNDQDNLGLTLLLIQKMALEDNFTFNFSHTYYNSGRQIIENVHSMVRGLIVPFIRDYQTYIHSNGNVKVELKMPQSNKVFIVHGHDNSALQTVARYVEKHGLEAIVLHERANKGRTIIEKIEANSDVGFAIVLLTPDDTGKANGETEYQARARQNVVLELGYFIGKIGRERVCALKTEHLEIPSDFTGVVWTQMDNAGGWKLTLAKELKEAGYTVNMDNVL